jgi:hypothetical protein
MKLYKVKYSYFYGDCHWSCQRYELKKKKLLAENFSQALEKANNIKNDFYHGESQFEIVSIEVFSKIDIV